MAETKTTVPVEIKIGNAGINESDLPAFKEGSILVAKDTKKIYIDPVGETKRIAVSGGDNSNISNDTATASLKQLQDSSYTGIKIKTKNSNAYNLDNTLTDNETIGSLGNFSSSFGGNTQAKGKRAFAIGTGTIAKGNYSFASGSDSVTLGSASHVEGYRNTTGPNADSAHAEGGENIVTSNRGHAEGYMNTVSGVNSHAEGGKNTVSGENSHAEGLDNIASGDYSHAEGQNTQAIGNQSHTEGAKTIARGDASHIEGDTNESNSYASHVEGSGNKVLTTINSGDTPGTGSGGTPSDPNFSLDEHRGDNSHVEGTQNLMYGYTAHVEGSNNKVKGHYSHAEGTSNTVDAEASHAEGRGNTVTSTATGSHAEGYSNSVSGIYSHVEGQSNVVSGARAHAEGNDTRAEGECAHSEGTNTKALGDNCHAEGGNTTASDFYSHAEGYGTEARGRYSHTQNEGTIAGYESQTAIGKFNDNKRDTLFEIGNGNGSARSNAFEVYTDGHAEVQKMGATDTSITTKKYVDDVISASSITVDTELSTTSENPVQNKVITNAMVGKKYNDKGEIFNHYTENVASGVFSHAEGAHTTASGIISHAEGQKTTASGYNSHAEGYSTKAVGGNSHAEGYDTTASGSYSHAQNFYTVAGYDYQTTMGKFNDNKSDTLLEVGNGTPSTSPTSPAVMSNAFEVYLDGHAEVQTMGTTNQSITTKKYVDDAIAASGGSGASSWSALTGKPFTTLGTDFTVTNGILSINKANLSIDDGSLA